MYIINSLNFCCIVKLYFILTTVVDIILTVFVYILLMYSSSTKYLTIFTFAILVYSHFFRFFMHDAQKCFVYTNKCFIISINFEI